MNQGIWYCGNIVVATFLCLNISLLSATGAPINIIDKEKYRDTHTFTGKSFAKEFSVNNRTVRCNGNTHGSSYPSPMYTCDEVNVDGEKLYHGYAIAAGSSKRSAKLAKEQCNEGCPCGTNEGQPNDIHALCTAMLRANDVQEGLLAAYVVNPACKLSVTPEKRVKYYLDDSGKEIWEDIDVTNGYINTLQCLTVLPENTGS